MNTPWSLQEFERFQVVIGSEDNPTRAWRGRRGTILGRDYWDRNNWRVRWDGNLRTSSVHRRYIQPELRHREW